MTPGACTSRPRCARPGGTRRGPARGARRHRARCAEAMDAGQASTPHAARAASTSARVPRRRRPVARRRRGARRGRGWPPTSTVAGLRHPPGAARRLPAGDRRAAAGARRRSYLPVAIERVEQHARARRRRAGAMSTLRAGAAASGDRGGRRPRRRRRRRAARWLARRAARARPAATRCTRPGAAPRPTACSTRSRWRPRRSPPASPPPTRCRRPLRHRDGGDAGARRAPARVTTWPRTTRSSRASRRCAADYIAAALRRLGWSRAVGERVGADELAARLGVVPAPPAAVRAPARDPGRRRPAARAPATAGRCARPLSPTLPGADASQRCSRASGARAELTLTERCGGALAEALRGAADPLQLLFPGGSHGDRRGAVPSSPAARAYNDAGRRGRRRACAPARHGPAAARARGRRRHRRHDRGRAARLPAERTDYLFTDVSPRVHRRARERFRDQPFLRSSRSTSSAIRSTQGFEPRRFDVVIAANVVHATADLRRTLAHCLRLLRPGGLLVLLEVTAPQRWIDITFGLTDGWWHFTDRDLRARLSAAVAGRAGARCWPELGPARSPRFRRRPRRRWRVSRRTPRGPGRGAARGRAAPAGSCSPTAPASAKRSPPRCEQRGEPVVARHAGETAGRAATADGRSGRRCARTSSGSSPRAPAATAAGAASSTCWALDAPGGRAGADVDGGPEPRAAAACCR